jgi:DNA-binding response OmpR family regulator
VTMNTKKKVLIIDDDRDACDLIRETLAPRGFDVFSCPEPEEALANAGEIRPDLIFISILFPQSNGLKISRAVHAVGGLEKVPIVMLISYPDELDPRYTSTIGIVDVALKPLKTEDILLKTVAVLGEGTAPDGIEAAGGSGTEEPASLDEEWLSFLEKEDSKPAEATLPVTAEDAAVAKEDSKTVDETEAFLLEEERDKQTHEAAGDVTYAEGPKRRPMKTFVAVAAAVLVAGAAAGAFLFFHGMQWKAAAPHAKATSKKEQAVAVQKKEAVSPSSRDKTPAGMTQAQTESQPAGKTVVEKPVAQNTARGNGAKPADAKQTEKDGKTYSVQVGAFQNEKNAVALSEKLKKKGYDSFIKRDDGSAVKRVLIGKFDAPGKASVQAKLVLEKEGLKSVIYHY